VQIDEAVSDSVTLVGIAHIEAEKVTATTRFKHCCDNSKHVSTEISVLDKHSVAWSVGLLGRGISPSQGCYLHTEQHKQNKRSQTPMPRVGFETTIPDFRANEDSSCLIPRGHWDRFQSSLPTKI
jgi:hypothetical protein